MEKLDVNRPYEKHISETGTFYMQDGKRFGNDHVQVKRATAKKSQGVKTSTIPDKAPPVPKPREFKD